MEHWKEGQIQGEMMLQRAIDVPIFRIKHTVNRIYDTTYRNVSILLQNQIEKLIFDIDFSYLLSEKR